VVRIDDREISGGKPGELTLRLRDIYLEHVRATLT
jgi:branched-subunit amino acid aminotransferase/4-amino-4-deoxychorismate lyase